MSGENGGMSVETREIERAEFMNGILINGEAIESLIGFNRSVIESAVPSQAMAQQMNNGGYENQRTIPDEPYTSGSIWPGECPICYQHENEGFLYARMNFILVCGHPLCSTCANRILATTKSCPKCRRLVDSFVRVRHASNNN